MSSLHKVPIHLDIEDKFILGLTLRQCMMLGIAAALSWSIFNEVSFWLPFQLGAQILAACAGLIVFCGVGCLAFLRINNRPIEQWAFVGLLYLISPRYYRWTYNYDVVLGSNVEGRNDREMQGEMEEEGW